jgi:cardiolipin synthase
MVGPHMNTVSTTRLPSRPLALPNILTYARIAAVPAVVACLYWQDVLQGGVWLRWVALAIFITAAVTDVLDGYFARKYGEQSTFGRMLDPIADKLLVASVLLMLAADGTIRGWSLWAAIVILCREILVSGLREYLAELRVSVPVTALAKWKTTLQLIAIGFLIAGDAGDLLLFPGISIASISIGEFGYFFGAGAVGLVTFIGLTLLWLSAILTLYTGWDYFHAGIGHLIRE